ncbi:low molecular weight protein-tyrosine-phosphatase [Pseudoalteromonas sp. BDTF-M6]|uniref:low molecular weight protein-tyrosine-phosphatase n=1 Tax=Pseudoalteromonas sp. BDTF-M6 TaxID=2796132 RepID=UPI001BB09B9D|nr:low molecular weight protein-tyrosine-phosphatase [Pseudoalteromonas sp. BDTF-M6]MBS3797574.1 low molecular weight phosphotyrosine protein phosphatase [Pseudoalteromonas sp. BDTF-M6]
MKIMFVCLGNICRSPTAHAIAQKRAIEQGLTYITFSSSGTSGYHVGEHPDERAITHGAQHGYDLSRLTAQRLTQDDFYEQDLLLTMDEQNYQDVLAMQPSDATASIKRLLDYHPDPKFAQVPDPYYGGQAGFDAVIAMCETAIDALFSELGNK